MKVWTIGLTLALAAGTATAEQWKTYRSEKFGFEISYPPEMEYKAYVDKEGGEIGGALLKDAKTGNTLVDFEIWPPDECPRQAANTVARDLGIERSKAVTQADGPDGSSSCGEPLTVKEFAGKYGVRFYELELTCTRESYGAEDDTVEAPTPVPRAPLPTPVLSAEGTKGPTYFVDISPSWKKQILGADPVGADPRVGQVKQKIEPALVRKILETVKTFAIQKPPVVCIDELQNRGFMMGVPVPARKP
jgi:hypothetical protein